MKITEQQLKQIIKEELDEMMDEPIMSDEEVEANLSDTTPLSPEERGKSDKSYEKKMILNKVAAVAGDAIDAGVTQEQFMSFVEQYLNNLTKDIDK